MNNQEQPPKNQQTPPDDSPVFELKGRVYLVPIRRRTLIIVLVMLVVWGYLLLWGCGYQTTPVASPTRPAQSAVSLSVEPAIQSPLSSSSPPRKERPDCDDPDIPEKVIIPFYGYQKGDKIIYVEDIEAALKELYKLQKGDFCSPNTIGDIMRLEEGYEQSYVKKINDTANVISYVYREFKNGDYIDRYDFKCRVDKIGNINICGWHSLKIDGQGFIFGQQLKGQDKIYDWILNRDTMRDREEMEYYGRLEIVKFSDNFKLHNLHDRSFVNLLVKLNRDGERYDGAKWIKNGTKLECLYDASDAGCNSKFVTCDDMACYQFSRNDVACAFINVYQVPFYDLWYKELDAVADLKYIALESFKGGIRYVEAHIDEREIIRHFYPHYSESSCAEFIYEFVYEINGQEVQFNNSLRGKDKVYDWLFENAFVKTVEPGRNAEGLNVQQQ